MGSSLGLCFGKEKGYGRLFPMTRRSLFLWSLPPFFLRALILFRFFFFFFSFQSGLCNASELESSRGGSIRIQHVTGISNASEGRSRFPKLDECAHFHYEHVEIGPLQVCN